MEGIEGLEESFKASKIVFLVTFGPDDERHSRPMTNVNTNPSSMMWFPTYRNTRKVRDIENNPRVRVFFPHFKDSGKYFELEGHAKFGDKNEVEEKWYFWYLYLHPDMSDYFWFPAGEKAENRAIINIFPDSAKLLSYEDLKAVSEPYKSYELK